MKKPTESVDTESIPKKKRYKSIIVKHRTEQKKTESPFEPKISEKERLFGEQLFKWRIRAGITVNDAGNRAFNVKSSNLIDAASAKRKWQRYEKGEFPALDTKKIKDICAAVGGNAQLGAAILKNKFISWKESEHDRYFHSPDIKMNDYFPEDGFEEDLQKYLTEKKDKDVSDSDWSFYGEPEKTKKPKRKSSQQTGYESLLVTKDFLINRRRKNEFDEGPADISRPAPSGNSLEYMINLQRFETAEDLEYERNECVEKFFAGLIVSDEDPSFNALQDLWLSFFGKGEEGVELLRQTVQFYGESCTFSEKDGQKFIYKYAAHYATSLLFRMYELAYDPLNPKSSADNLTGQKLIKYNTVEEFAVLVERVFEVREEQGAQRKLLCDLFDSSYVRLPPGSRLKLKKDFSRAVFALAPQDKVLDLLKTPEICATLKKEFKALVMVCFSKLYYLEKEICYLLNEEEQSTVVTKQTRLIEPELKEKHTLFRFYKTVKPQEFLTSLWLLQDTFDLYNLKLKEIADNDLSAKRETENDDDNIE